MANVEQWNRISKQGEILFLMTDAQRKTFIENVLKLCDNNRDRATVSFFYIYGLRPDELLKLVRSDFNIREDDILVRLPTSKGGQTRFITLAKSTPFMDIVIHWVENTPIADWKIFRTFNDPTNFNKIMERLEKRYSQTYNKDVCLSPYAFRKFRIAWIQEHSKNNSEILAWKGGKSLKVVEDSYSYIKPVTSFKDILR